MGLKRFRLKKNDVVIAWQHREQLRVIATQSREKRLNFCRWHTSALPFWAKLLNV
jgi:hypothetical protein